MNEFQTEILDLNDLRSDIYEFIATKRTEIEGLKERVTYFIPKIFLRPNSNVLGNIFVRAYKHSVTDQEVTKSLYVVQIFNDRYKSVFPSRFYTA